MLEEPANARRSPTVFERPLDERLAKHRNERDVVARAGLDQPDDPAGLARGESEPRRRAASLADRSERVSAPSRSSHIPPDLLRSSGKSFPKKPELWVLLDLTSIGRTAYRHGREDLPSCEACAGDCGTVTSAELG